MAWKIWAEKIQFDDFFRPREITNREFTLVLSTTQLCIFVLCLIQKKQQHEVKDILMFNLIADPKNKKEDKTGML
jgi:hypothetical protein